MFEDGLFVYQYEASHDDMPDGVEVLNFFLEDLFGKRDLEEAPPIPSPIGAAGRTTAPSKITSPKASSRAGSAAASPAGTSRPASNTSTKSKTSLRYVETKVSRPAASPASPEPADYQGVIDGSIAASASPSRAGSNPASVIPSRAGSNAGSRAGSTKSARTPPPRQAQSASSPSIRAPGAPRVTVGFKMKQIEQLLHKGHIRSMAQLRSKSKRELDELGLALGPRAKISGAVETWKPPKYNDESFVMRGRWQAKEVGKLVQVRFIGQEEELAAYDNVRVPSKADFTLDASFLPSGSCRALNGNMPIANGLQRAFLSYLTDPREEEEVGWVRVKKETITNMIGSRLSALAKDADWLMGEYAVQSNELVKSGGCYVDGPQVKRSQDKMTQLKSTIDQCVAVFEDYYGSVR